MRVIARDTDGLLFGIDADEDASRIVEVLGQFSSLSSDGRSPFWSSVTTHAGDPLWGVVVGSKRYVLFSREAHGPLGEVVKFTEHALAGAVADPPRLSGRGPDGKHLWARSVAQAVVQRQLRPDGAQRTRIFQTSWDSADSPPFPALIRLQVGTPAQLAELAPRLGLKPFGLYLRAEVDPAFGKPGSVVGLDPGTDLVDWAAVDWRDQSGGPVHATTEPGQPGISVLTTLSAKAQRWMKARAERTPPAVSVVAVRQAGRAGPAIDARLLDQDEDPDSLRVFYTDESAAGLRRFALDIGPRLFARFAGLSPWAARRLARSGKPTAAMVRRAFGGLVTTNFVLPSCACGQPLRRPNAQACSGACRQRAYRERQARQA